MTMYNINGIMLSASLQSVTKIKHRFKRSGEGIHSNTGFAQNKKCQKCIYVEK